MECYQTGVFNAPVKIELGCGASKNIGFLGIDRFDLAGVDIVADLNAGIPLEDNSVDVLYAQHSLEHFTDLKRIMREIYRVCKDRSLVMILAPYYFTTTNISNPYHYQAFTAETLRFFSNDPDSVLSPLDYENPHAKQWGLESSDNSTEDISITPIHFEFFYFPEYRALDNDTKRMLRRSLLNVCDQFFCACVVNKSKTPVSQLELTQLLERLTSNVPDVVGHLRTRDLETQTTTPTLIDCFTKDLREETFALRKKAQQNEARFSAAEKVLREETVVLRQMAQRHSELLAANASELQCLSEKYTQLNNYMVLCNKWNNMGWKPSRFHHAKDDHLLELLPRSSAFFDQLLLRDFIASKDSLFSLSPVVPMNGYMEYRLVARGAQMHIWVEALIDSGLIIEIVKDAKILQQSTYKLTDTQELVIQNPFCSGVFYIRFRAENDKCLIRIAEYANRKYWFLKNKHLAAYFG